LSVHGMTHPGEAVADIAVTTALWPGRRTTGESGTGARLLNLTSLMRVGTVFPVAARTITRGQPRTVHLVLAILRNTTFHTCWPIPSAGSPGMAAGMLIRNSLAWHRGVAEPAEAAGPDTDVRADAGPVVSVASATEAVMAHRTVRSRNAPRAICGIPPVDT
jgi:hypothetical protein